MWFWYLRCPHCCGALSQIHSLHRLLERFQVQHCFKVKFCGLGCSEGVYRSASCGDLRPCRFSTYVKPSVCVHNIQIGFSFLLRRINREDVPSGGAFRSWMQHSFPVFLLLSLMGHWRAIAVDSEQHKELRDLKSTSTALQSQYLHEPAAAHKFSAGVTFSFCFTSELDITTEQSPPFWKQWFYFRIVKNDLQAFSQTVFFPLNERVLSSVLRFMSQRGVYLFAVSQLPFTFFTLWSVREEEISSPSGWEGEIHCTAAAVWTLWDWAPCHPLINIYLDSPPPGMVDKMWCQSWAFPRTQNGS